MTEKNSGDYDYKQLDPLFHSPIRLAIISLLMSTEEAEFTYIRDKIGATDGNLSRHLSKLEDHGLIDVKKEFIGKKPVTYQKLSTKGRSAFIRYIQTLETFIGEYDSGQERNAN